MSRIILIAFVVAFFLAGLSCDLSTHADTIPIRENSAGLLPMKLGNKWVFRYYQYDTTGLVEGAYLDSAVVSRDTVVNHERWYKIHQLKPADGDDLDWYTNRSDGLWVLRHLSDTSIAYLNFKFPTAKGESWGNSFRDSTRTIATDSILFVSPSQPDTCIVYEDHCQFRSFGPIYAFRPSQGLRSIDIYSITNGGNDYGLHPVKWTVS
jgi:hypothetical protein